MGTLSFCLLFRRAVSAFYFQKIISFKMLISSRIEWEKVLNKICNCTTLEKMSGLNLTEEFTFVKYCTNYGFQSHDVSVKCILWAFL